MYGHNYNTENHYMLYSFCARYLTIKLFYMKITVASRILLRGFY